MKNEEIKSLEKAIEILKEIGLYSNIIANLENILQSTEKNENGRRWTQEKILETINKWVLTHGYNPTHKDFQSKDLPKPITIENKFHMKLSDFLNLYFPYNKPKNKLGQYHFTSEEDLISNFILQYNRIKPKNAREYNIKRNMQSPTWSTVARYCYVTTWLELIEKLNLNISNLSKQPNVKIHKDVISDVDMYKELNGILNKRKTRMK